MMRLGVFLLGGLAASGVAAVPLRPSLGSLGSPSVQHVQYESSLAAGSASQIDVLAGDTATVDGALKLCQCEDAAISANGGLNCVKDGWFISTFEATGHWIAGGGQVPLSRARCCRLCLPDVLAPETQALLPANTTLESVVSVGCHPSVSSARVSCEVASAAAFMTGFQHAVRVPGLASATYYPEAPPLCCTPVVTLSDGEAWEVVHCDCMWTGTAGCGGDSDDRLLWGYASYRNAGDGSVVPIAPAQCCKACLGTRVHAFNACESLGRCHGHGICMLDTCECDAGWGGPACASSLRASGWIPQWLLYVLMVAVLVVSFGAMAATYGLVEDWTVQRRQAALDAAAALDPLLVAQGSVGDEDTESDDDEDRTQAGIHIRPPAPAQASAADESGSSAPEAGRDTSVAREGLAADSDARSMSQSQPSAAQTELASRLAAGGEGDEAGGVEEPLLKEREKAGGEGSDAEDVDDEEKMDPELAAYLANKFDEKRSPLHGVKCGICFDRPVQVALVPCGHSNLCRRCARKLTECPFCRRDIVRRQRLYLAD